MNSTLRDDLMFFMVLLIWKMCVLASFIMLSICLLDRETIACFLEGSLVVYCIFFFFLLADLGKMAL